MAGSIRLPGSASSDSFSGSRPAAGKPGRSTVATRRRTKRRNGAASAAHTHMGLEFLARVRSASLWLTAISALVVATYATPLAGLAVACGGAWSLANLALLQALIVTLTGADRRTTAATGRAIFAIGGLLGLFTVGWFLLLK